MDKTYLVTYKTGRSQTVTGNIVFFSAVNTALPRIANAVYLNADAVMSVVEQTEKQESSSYKCPTPEEFYNGVGGLSGDERKEV